MIFPEKTYNILAWINRVVLPAVIALISGILALCSIEHGAIVFIDGVLALVNTFLGSILQDSKAKYEALEDNP